MTRDDDAERGSLPMVMLVMLIGLALGAVLVPTVLVQSRSTVFTTTRQNALHAAQAGVDTAIGRIRATSPDGGTADTTKLPCTTSGSPVSGPVAGAGAESFAAQIAYYVSDPVKFTSASPMTCVPGKGVYDSATGLSAPAYARITSVGTDGASSGQSRSRTLVSTYAFQTSNANVAGGQIPIYPPDSDPATPLMCMDAGASPQAGNTVSLAMCSSASPVPARQVWAYRSDLTIQLSTAAVSTGTYPNGLCLDTDVSAGAPVAGNAVVLQPCNASGSPPYQQQWSSNDNIAYQASGPNSKSTGSLPNLCMKVDASQAAGTPVVLATCFGYGSGNDRQPTQSWRPQPTVGAGGAANPQRVNYQQFGRCMDTYRGPVGLYDEYNQYVLLYPCKQNPKADAILWNEKVYYDSSTGWLYLVHPDGATKLCLYSPRAENGPVRLTKCTDPTWPGHGSDPALSVTADQLKWTLAGDSLSLPYAERYRILDTNPGSTRCLSLAAPSAASPAASPVYGSYQDNYSVLVLSSCNGSKAQKWNADPRIGAPTVQDTVERPNSP